MILVLGDIAVDIVSRLRTPLAYGSDAAAEVRVMPGGSGANVAVWLARLGHPTTFLGRVGQDFFGDWLAADLEREGVTPALVVDGNHRTGAIQVLVDPDGERTMIADRGANAHWQEGDVPEALVARAKLLHIVGYVLLDHESRRGARRAMTYARIHGVPISLDPSSHAPLLGLGPAGFWGLVGDVSLLLPNRVEAQVLAETVDLNAALEKLQTYAQVVAIKLDRDGCLAGHGPDRWREPAPLGTILNATGAGDAFNAGFLGSWLAGGDLREACREGVRLGTHAATLATTR